MKVAGPGGSSGGAGAAAQAALEQKLNRLKEGLEKARNWRIRAEERKDQLERQRLEVVEEIRRLGVEPEALDAEIEKLQREIEALLAEAERLIPWDLLRGE